MPTEYSIAVDGSSQSPGHRTCTARTGDHQALLEGIDERTTHHPESFNSVDLYMSTTTEQSENKPDRRRQYVHYVGYGEWQEMIGMM